MPILSRNKPLISVIILIIIVVIFYYLFNFFFLYTNDAYLQANVVDISPQISGNITQVNVKDLQHVHAGDLLLTIDDKNYQQKLKLAKASVKKARNQYMQLNDKLMRLLFALKKSRADEQFKQKQWQRYNKLHQQAAISSAKANHAYSIWRQAQESVNILQQSLLTIKKLIGKSLGDYAPYEQAQAKLSIARINEKHTKLYSPVNGYITSLSLQRGDYAKSGKALFSIIQDNTWWVTANIKENNLHGIKSGNTAYLSISASSTGLLKGHVYGIGWGVNRRDASSNVVSSPLPYIPRKIEWIRIAQRFPVRINLSKPPAHTPLRIGATVHIFMVRHHGN